MSNKLKFSQLGRSGWLILIPITILGAYSAWLYDYGKRNASGELVKLRQTHKTLDDKFSELKKEKKSFVEQTAILERSSQIDRQANLGVREEVVALQDELHDVRKELELYRGIISPGDVKPGLRVQRLDIEAAEKEGLFLFDLTLTQVKRRGRSARGVVGLEVLGEDNGNKAVLVFNTLGDDGKNPLKFKFRYFQHFQGEIRLPKEFKPRRISVKLTPQGKKRPPAIEKEFAWPFRKGAHNT
ncbi:MAG: DUF6776 family protein [Gammaproteobacteria bacterium]